MDMNGMNSMGSGLDFATFMNSALRNNDDGVWGGNGGLLWIFLLILCGGWGGNGFSNRGQAGQLTNDAAVTGAVDAAIQRARADGLSDQSILDAIRGNQTIIQTLATTFNTDISNVQQSLCALNGGIDKLSGQIGLSGQQVINAIQMGNMNLVQQLMSCCCDTKTLITQQAHETQLATMEQTNTLSDRMQTGFSDIRQLIDNQTAQMTAGFQGIKDMFTQNKIDSLQAEVNRLQANANNSSQTAYLQNYINSQIAPMQTTLNNITNKIPNNPQPAVVVGTANGNYGYGGWNNSCCAMNYNGGCGCNNA